jgi:hypothetical protein
MNSASGPFSYDCMSKENVPEKTGVISWLYHVGAEGTSAVYLQPKIIQLEEWTALLS